MKTTSNYIRLSLLLICLLCLSQTTQAVPEEMLWPSDGLSKLMRSAMPSVDAGVPVRMAGARGEIVSGQAVFRPAEDLAGSTVNITDLRHRGSSAAIPTSAAKLQWVRYIDVDRNSGAIPDDELVAKAPTSIPDPYWEDVAIPVKASQAQPIWIEVHVPKDAKAGDYDAKLTVTGGDNPVELPVVLHVWNFEMPAERHLSVINWWSVPGPGFNKRIESYSDQYWDLLAKFSAFVVEHRQTDVSTTIGLIQESGNDKEGYTYDTSRLERYAEVVFSAGIQQIHLHAVGLKTAHILNPVSRIKPKEYAMRRLTALEKMIRRRKWQGRFVVTISDEPFIHHEETFAKLVEKVHEIAPGVRCVEAVETEYLGKLDIYVPKLSHLNLWYQHFDRIRREGAELWFYTCCHPFGKYPNRFLDLSLLKVRVLHWINYLYDLDGYLHWGLNKFAGDEFYTQKGISEGLPLGDRAIAYPGKEGLIGSLRFSAQRDGLQDFEYMWVLEDQLAKIKERVGRDAFWLDPRQRSLELCRRVVWSFHEYTRDPNLLFETRRTIAEEIEALQTKPLLVVQTSPPEGTAIPAGPRHVNVRGLVPPGAAVTLNNAPIKNLRPSGYFLQAHFMSDNNPTITVTVEHNGKERTTKRTFELGLFSPSVQLDLFS